MTVATVLEVHNNALMSQFPIKLCKNKHGSVQFEAKEDESKRPVRKQVVEILT